MKINKIIEKERKIKSIKTKNGIINEFSRSLLLSNEYNQALVDCVKSYNIIDFGNEAFLQKYELIERKLREIYNNSQNKQDIIEENYPIIWFKNLNKCGPLEETLLPIFDSQQNTELFNKEVNLAKFILISTSSDDISKLSDPLLSRLDIIDASKFKTKQFFLDKYYKPILFFSLFFNLILLFLIFIPRCKKHLIKWKCNCK